MIWAIVPFPSYSLFWSYHTVTEGVNIEKMENEENNIELQFLF